MELFLILILIIKVPAGSHGTNVQEQESVSFEDNKSAANCQETLYKLISKTLYPQASWKLQKSANIKSQQA